MLIKILSFSIIGLILIFGFLLTGHNAAVTFTLNEQTFETSLPLLWLYLMLFMLIVCLLTHYLGRLFLKLEKKSLIYDAPEQKIVLKQHDVSNAMMLLLKAMTSITEGDMKKARQNLSGLQKIIGDNMLIDVLRLKMYKGEKNFDQMKTLSEKLSKNPDLELVGLKASLEAQMHQKEFEQALKAANEAFKKRQDLFWVIDSAFQLRAKAKDWEGALEVLNAGYEKKLIVSPKYEELKSTALYKIADTAKKEGNTLKFFKYCAQAYEILPSFVPASLALAAYYTENDHQIKRASKILTKTWMLNPTLDIARAYLNLWPQDKPADRVQRMEDFAGKNSRLPSLNNLILAELSMKAKLWSRAKNEFEIFLINNPATQKLARLIAEYEKKVNKNDASSQSWKKRAETCVEDGAWVCESCGRVCDSWHPSCQQCGKVGQFKWHLCVKKNNRRK